MTTSVPNPAVPIPVDFANADTDGAVRLITRGTTDHCKAHGIVFTEGMPVVMSDGEIVAEGTLSNREGVWVAVVNKWSV